MTDDIDPVDEDQAARKIVHHDSVVKKAVLVRSFGASSRFAVRICAMTRWSFHIFVRSDATPPLSRIAQRIPFFTSRRIRKSLEEVASNHGADAIILRKAIPVPHYLRLAARRAIRNSGEDQTLCKSRWTKRAMKQIVYILGTIGHRPLVQSYYAGAEYINQALSIEYTTSMRNAGYPHKLPRDVATIQPELPFGPSIWGSTRAKFTGGFSPDLVAFIVLDKATIIGSRIEEIGPRVYTVDHICSHLQAATQQTLTDNCFMIKADPRVGVHPKDPTKAEDRHDNTFGGARKINLLGERRNGVRYMRVDKARMMADPEMIGDNTESSVEVLKNVFQQTRFENPRLNLKRGDVLVVNNRRAATEWEDEIVVRSVANLGNRSTRHVKRGERVILQMSFYTPTEIPV